MGLAAYRQGSRFPASGSVREYHDRNRGLLRPAAPTPNAPVGGGGGGTDVRAYSSTARESHRVVNIVQCVGQ